MSDIKRDERWENVSAVFLPCAKFDLDIDTLSNIDWWIFRIEVVYKGQVFWQHMLIYKDDVTDFGLNKPEPKIMFNFTMRNLVIAMDKRLDHYDETGKHDV